MHYRFLNQTDIPQLAEAFNLAFADYYVDIKVSPSILEGMITRERVRLDLSVGAFDNAAGGVLAGFLINGVDEWQGQLTAYDGGTGVIPAYRGQGIAGATFDFALPKLRSAGVRQYLLEVIQENEAALNVYLKKGFTQSRTLECFKLTHRQIEAQPVPGINLRQLEYPEWLILQSFWDWWPSWQNSVQALQQMAQPHIWAAFDGPTCVGYIAGHPPTRLLQLAVAPSHRRRGIASWLLQTLNEALTNPAPLMLLNVDGGDAASLAFFEHHHFSSYVSQYEMRLKL